MTINLKLHADRSTWLELYLFSEDALDHLPNETDDHQHDGERDRGGGEGLDQPQPDQARHLNRNN